LSLGRIEAGGNQYQHLKEYGIDLKIISCGFQNVYTIKDEKGVEMRKRDGW